jgi:hypothetical protein
MAETPPPSGPLAGPPRELRELQQFLLYRSMARTVGWLKELGSG